MGSKFLFAIVSTALMLGILCLSGFMLEWIRPKNIVAGLPDGRIYLSANRSIVDIDIFNISDMCNFRSHLVIVNRFGHVFFDKVFQFELPIEIEWCASKRNDELYFGSDALVFVYPSMRKELWAFPGAKAVDWYNDKWNIGQESFRFKNEDEMMRLNKGWLEHLKISTNFVVQREYIGLDAKGLAWV